MKTSTKVEQKYNKTAIACLFTALFSHNVAMANEQDMVSEMDLLNELISMESQEPSVDDLPDREPDGGADREPDQEPDDDLSNKEPTEEPDQEFSLETDYLDEIILLETTAMETFPDEESGEEFKEDIDQLAKKFKTTENGDR